jgi:hypothetical protein
MKEGSVLPKKNHRPEKTKKAAAYVLTNKKGLLRLKERKEEP